MWFFLCNAATALPCLLYRLDGQTALLYDRESVRRCWVRRREGLSITHPPEGLRILNVETSWFKWKYKDSHVLHVNAKFPSAYIVSIQRVCTKSPMHPLWLSGYFSHKLNEPSLWGAVTPSTYPWNMGKSILRKCGKVFPGVRLWSVVFLPLTICQEFHLISLTFWLEMLHWE